MGAAESEPVPAATSGPSERKVRAVDGTLLPSKLFAAGDPHACWCRLDMFLPCLMNKEGL